METKLAVPIAASNTDEAGEQIKSAQAAGADILELRTDYLENLNVDLVKNLIAGVKNAGEKKLPIIVTCRDKQQGGAIDYPARLRVDVLTAALKAGAEFIDYEYENFRSTEGQERIRLALSQSSKGRLILSAHNFETKFNNIGKLYRNILNICPVAIPKLVYAANHINDCFDISRILAKKLGSFVTFASVDETNATAPGQLTIKDLKDLYRYDYINAETRLFGVIADPVGHSLSPAIHNACFTDKQMNKLYLPLLVEGGQREFDLFVHNALLRKWLDFRGFSITIPHKQNALAYVRTSRGFVEPLAQKIGAANTLLVGPDGKLEAYNTDYAGALDAITKEMKISRARLKDLPVAVVGAGGVARAIVAGLNDAGAKIRIYNRTLERGQKLAAEFDCEFAPLEDLNNMDAKLLINCTSIGMHPNVEATPVPKESLKRGMAVFDTVYNPAQTLLLKEAKKKRIKTIDGISMFVNQAMAQFKLFTQNEGNSDLMREVVLENL